MRKKLVKLETILKNTQGFTLIEILVAMVISITIMVLATQLFTGGFTAYYEGYFGYKAQTESISVIQKIGGEVRQASDLIDASPQTITIQEYLDSTDSAPAQVRFYLNGTDLIRGEILPVGVQPPYTYDPLTETFKTISSGVVNGSNVIFTYYDQDGMLITQPVSEAEVTLIQVDLDISRNGYGDPLPISTKVQLRYNKTNL